MVWTGIYKDIELGLIKYDPLENGSPVCPYCGRGLNLTSPQSDDWYCPVSGEEFTSNRLERISLTWSWVKACKLVLSRPMEGGAK